MLLDIQPGVFYANKTPLHAILMQFMLLTTFVCLANENHRKPLELNLKLGIGPYPLAIVSEQYRHWDERQADEAQQRVSPTKA